MILYFDTSALLKKYISENGSEIVDNLFMTSSEIIISKIGQIESISAFRRLLIEKEIEQKDYEMLKRELNYDFQFFSVLNMTEGIISSSIEMIDKYQLKTLDSIHLGSVVSVKNQIDCFVCCDYKLRNAAQKEGIKIKNPNE